MNNYFTLYEFLYSESALEKKIPNWPEDFWVIDNIKDKLLPALNGLREAWGGPIKITSGYRSPELNKAVGGVKNSVHMKGLAADLYPVNGDIKLFEYFVPEYFKDKPFDQIIKEQSGNSRWIHFGIESGDGKQRKQILGIKL